MDSESVAASASVAQSAPPPLSQWQRLAYIFVSPTKTFTDILRSGSWWLPFVLTVVVSYGFTYAVQKQVGWEKVAENGIQQSPRQQERLANLSPDQAAAVKHSMVTSFRYISYCAPLLALAIAVVVSALLLATLNFLFGGRATFGKMMAVYFYSTFPLNLKYLLAILVLFAGMNPDQFNVQNPIGSNLGYFLSPDSPGWLVALATQVGIFTIWGLVLFSMGSAIVARLKRGQGATAVVGWWLLLTIIIVGASAIGGSR